MTDTNMIDPLGRRIILYDRTWYGHILRGHPDVADYRHGIRHAVENPDEIRYSTSDTDCRVYYGADLGGGLRVAVVADVLAGVVKTVYLTRKSSPGGVEWSSLTL